MSDWRMVLIAMLLFSTACAEKKSDDDKKKKKKGGDVILLNDMIQPVQIEAKSDAYYNELEQLKTTSESAKHIKELYVASQQIRQQSIEMNNYIVNLQAFLISEVDEVPFIDCYTEDKHGVRTIMPLHDVKKKDNYDIPMEILLGSNVEEPKQGEHTAHELKQKIHAYRDEIVAVLASIEGFEETVALIKNELTIPETAMEHDEEVPWETASFNHAPLVAAVTVISGLKVNVFNAEASAVSFLMNKLEDNNDLGMTSPLHSDSTIIKDGDSVKVIMAEYK